MTVFYICENIDYFPNEYVKFVRLYVKNKIKSIQIAQYL